MWRQAALVLTLAAAGCLQPAGDLAPASLAPLALLPEALAMDQPSDGAEPTVAVLDARTLFITAKAGNQDEPSIAQGASWLWRSTDGGATWETLRAPTRAVPTTPATREPVRASDPDVVVSPDGWVYYLDWWIARVPVVLPQGVLPLPVGLPVATNFVVERSADGGDTWQSAPLVIPMTDGLSVDRPWMVAGEDGFLAVFYNYGGGASGASGIRFVASTDHGATWGEPMVAVEETPDAVLLIAHPWMLPGERIFLPYGVIRPADDEDLYDDPAEARVAYSDDAGATWTDLKVADVPGGFRQIWPLQGAVSPDGRAYVVWGEVVGDEHALWIADSVDGAATWSTPRSVAARGSNLLPWVAAHDGGRVAVGYYAADLRGLPREAPEGTQWHAMLAQSADGGATFTVTRSAQPVKVGPLCPEGTRCEREVPSHRELQDYPGLAYAPDGALHFSFAKSRELPTALAGHVLYNKVIP